MERKRFWVDFRDDSIALMEGNEELVMWTEEEWIEDPQVVFPICNAILLGLTKGAEEIKRRLGLPKEVAEEEIICPHCDEPMDYKALGNGDDKLTHIWVCSACPNIMFEFYDMSDLKALQKYLSRSGKES